MTYGQVAVQTFEKSDLWMFDAARLARVTVADLDAQDLATRCLAGFYDSAEGSSDWEAGLGSCEHALQMDNRNVIALSLITFKYILPAVKIQSTDPEAKAAIRQADKFASRALAIDPNYYWDHAAKAAGLLAQRRPDAAIAELERSLAPKPDFAPGSVLLWDEFIGKFRFLVSIGFLPRRKNDLFVLNLFVRNQTEEVRDAVQSGPSFVIGLDDVPR